MARVELLVKNPSFERSASERWQPVALWFAIADTTLATIVYGFVS